MTDQRTDSLPSPSDRASSNRAISGSVSEPLGASYDDVIRLARRRDRLLSALTLIAGAGLALATPFALKSGAEFFMPVTIALVIAVALVPVLQWLERRRVPSPIAAILCILAFLLLTNIAIAAIVVPAIDFFRLLPTRIPRIQENLSPLLDLYSALEKSVNKMLRQVASSPGPGSVARFIASPRPVPRPGGCRSRVRGSSGSRRGVSSGV